MNPAGRDGFGPAASSEATAGEAAARSAGASLEALWAAHHRAVFAAAYRVTGRAADAEDVLQTVFLRLARRPERLDEAGAAAYLRRAAVNAAIDLVRGRRREAELPEGDAAPPAAEADPERRHGAREAARALRRALTGLRPQAAEVFALRFFEGLGNKEIARLLGLSQTAVAVTLHRTRRRLSKDLAAELGG